MALEGMTTQGPHPHPRFLFARSLVWNQDLKRDLAGINQIQHLSLIALLPDVFPRLEITGLRYGSQHPD
jgi:hypothetical protein